ncbi:MAG: phage major capsid protein [Kiritimatiellae bacterium]|nr:phage major capsid protein [Kiritimatiellia bacterium]
MRKPLRIRSACKSLLHVTEICKRSEYVEAYANAIRKGDDKFTECRALLSENAASGTVPVPTVIYEIVKNSWQRNGIVSRVRRLAVKGNLKVSFEISATGAVVHTEGGDPISEESLILGVLTIVPQSVKKFLNLSDEIVDMRGEEFLRYVYDEITYQIAKKIQALIIAAIEACGTVSTNVGTTCVGVPVVATASIALGTIASALGQLSDQASNPIIVMNKQTWSAFKAVQAAGNYGYDPFEGLAVEFDNSIAAFSAATSGVTFAYVGDFGEGALLTTPNGDDVTLKYDETTLATNDLVRIIGRQMVGVGIVGPNCFVKIAKPEE